MTYHGVLAPAAGIRPWVVPRVEARDDGGCLYEGADAHVDEHVENEAVDAEMVRQLLRQRAVPHPGQRSPRHQLHEFATRR